MIIGYRPYSGKAVGQRDMPGLCVTPRSHSTLNSECAHRSSCCSFRNSTLLSCQACLHRPGAVLVVLRHPRTSLAWQHKHVLDYGQLPCPMRDEATWQGRHRRPPCPFPNGCGSDPPWIVMQFELVAPWLQVSCRLPSIRIIRDE
jgi:hypothetical protein